jgi:hypothetical protein
LPVRDRYKADPNAVSQAHFDWYMDKLRRPVASGHYPELLKYCEFRGITKEVLNDWRVSSKGPKALRWPIYAWHDNNWTICNSRVRVCIDRDKVNCTDWYEQKGGPTGLLLGNHLLDFNQKKRAIIYEGQWDAMISYQLGLANSFSLPNGAGNVNVASMLRYIPDDWEVWLCMDNDEAGQIATERFFAQLGPDRVARLKLPHKDLNEWAIHKPSLSAKDVENCAEGLTTLCVLSGDVAKDSYMGIDMGDSDDDKPDIVATTPWEHLNELFGGGFLGGQTTGLLAPSGMGKTTMCNQVAVHNARAGSKVGLISLEGTRDALKRKIKDCIRGCCTPAEYKNTINNLFISQFEGNNVTWEECVNEFEVMVKGGAKLLVLDNLDFITRDKNGFKINAYAALIEQARRHNTHTIVVWQPNKVDRDQRVNSGNQKGYSQTFQDSDNYINVNPIEDFTQLEVEKCREHGINKDDNKVWLLYDKPTRCFNETVKDVLPNESSGRVIDLTQRRLAK